MSIDLCRDVAADEIDEGDLLDLEDNEYGDNPKAMYGFALVERKREWYDEDNFPWVTLYTDQGTFDMPAGHLVKLKVDE